jgi:hypothetical protein
MFVVVVRIYIAGLGCSMLGSESQSQTDCPRGGGLVGREDAANCVVLFSLA